MTLLRLDPQGVTKLINQYEEDCKAIKRLAMSLSWYTRGGASYEDVLNMSAEERKIIQEMADNNMEITKKSQMPFF